MEKDENQDFDEGAERIHVVPSMAYVDELADKVLVNVETCESLERRFKDLEIRVGELERKLGVSSMDTVVISKTPRKNRFACGK